ncbi:MAG: glycosyltransferase [Candidatus Cloacimonetes bacterium]|nr:glycosyltransferase [Candidatus Cloacimonadota bacterium]
MDPLFLLISALFVIFGYGILRSSKVNKILENRYSILIACRNEEENLPRLFKSLDNLTYPQDKYEILIVDDVSSDNSYEMIKSFCSTRSNAHGYHLEKKSKEYLGKKAALKFAAEQAQFEILLFTDADCFPHNNWISSYNKYITDKTGFVVGSYYENNTNSFQRFGNEISAAIYAASVGLGLPFSAAGGNMAVRKAAFLQVGGYEKIKNNLAGDDKQLLNLIRKTDWQVRYNPELLISTDVNETDSQQKNKRKYGKFLMSSPLYQIISLLIFAFYLYLPFKIFVVGDLKNLLLYLFSALIFWLANLYKHKFKFIFVDLLYIIIYPYFIIWFSILGITGNWEWKN